MLQPEQWTTYLQHDRRWAMSLAFHIIFAAIGIAMPLLMIIAEWKWLRSKDEIYLTLAKRSAKGLQYSSLSGIFVVIAKCMDEYAGALLLFPSYCYLFRIFKREPS